MAEFVKKRVAAGEKAQSERAADPTPSELKRWPALLEYLTLAVLDGSPRQTATVLTFCEDGRFKACFRDREAALIAFVSGDSLLGLLDAIEKGLATDRLDWRAEKVWAKKK